MTIDRSILLSRLNEASPGLSTKEVLEQSNAFVFTGGKLVTFNDNIMVRVESPLDFEVVVNATDFLAILTKIPDEQLEVYTQDGELRIKGKKRSAGITCSSEVHLPLNAVPDAQKWSKLPDGIMHSLLQAARTCGRDETQYLATVVHVTPERIEATDNLRFFRVQGETGFPAEVLIPAASIATLEGLEIVKVSIGEGWLHTKTSGGAQVSLRCSQEAYHTDIDRILEMQDPEDVILPGNLAEMIERAETFASGTYDAKVGIHIEDENLTITSRKEAGWYRESKRVRYSGRPLDFEVHPKFLAEVLERTRDVVVDDRRMKLQMERTTFMVALTVKGSRQEESTESTEPSEA